MVGFLTHCPPPWLVAPLVDKLAPFIARKVKGRMNEAKEAAVVIVIVLQYIVPPGFGAKAVENNEIQRKRCRKDIEHVVLLSTNLLIKKFFAEQIFTYSNAIFFMCKILLNSRTSLRLKMSLRH